MQAIKKHAAQKTFDIEYGKLDVSEKEKYGEQFKQSHQILMAPLSHGRVAISRLEKSASPEISTIAKSVRVKADKQISARTFFQVPKNFAANNSANKRK